MRELSIFIDESGDFGPFEKHAPYYVLSLVFHVSRAMTSAITSTRSTPPSLLGAFRRATRSTPDR